MSNTRNESKADENRDSIQKQYSSYSELYNEHEKFGITNGRKIARFLSRFKWYNPIDNSNNNCSTTLSSETNALLAKSSSSKEQRISLDSGWAYFEHNTLPRRLVKDDGTEVLHATENIKVESGVTFQKSKLYNLFDTYIYELSDFGIGIGLYL